MLGGGGRGEESGICCSGYKRRHPSGSMTAGPQGAAAGRRSSRRIDPGPVAVLRSFQRRNLWILIAVGGAASRLEEAQHAFVRIDRCLSAPLVHGEHQHPPPPQRQLLFIP